MPNIITVLDRRTGTPVAHPVLDLLVQPAWRDAARRKGFVIRARIGNRYHLALECRRCGAVSKVKLFVLTRTTPACPGCLDEEWRRDAETAGAVLLRRDADDRHYGWYRLSCSHEVRRQFGSLTRVAAGKTGLRCEICLENRDAAAAKARGWRLVEPDPEGNPNYRLYAHQAGCGQRQRVARVNMQTGRFACTGCGLCWSAAPSALYLMRFALPDGAPVIKLGYSADPASRLRYQLRRRRDLPGSLARVVPMATGHAAHCAEKALHRHLRRAFPDAVVAPERFDGMLRVKSEIYAGWLEEHVLRLLERVDPNEPAASPSSSRSHVANARCVSDTAFARTRAGTSATLSSATTMRRLA